jgi:hypothetical protein
MNNTNQFDIRANGGGGKLAPTPDITTETGEAAPNTPEIDA